MKILAIEDNERKWKRVEAIVSSTLGDDANVTWVRDLYEGERLVEQPGWDLLILDISLDIKAGAARGGRGAHDFTGGLKIASRMFYLECEIPTVIVTGFDAFPTSVSHEDNVILGVDDVDRQARSYLHDFLLGTLRVGSPKWESSLSDIIRQVAQK